MLECLQHFKYRTNFFKVSFVFCAASLINVLFLESVRTDGLFALGRFVVAPSSFRLRMMDMIMLQGNKKDLDMFFITPT